MKKNFCRRHVSFYAAAPPTRDLCWSIEQGVCLRDWYWLGVFVEVLWCCIGTGGVMCDVQHTSGLTKDTNPARCPRFPPTLPCPSPLNIWAALGHMHLHCYPQRTMLFGVFMKHIGAAGCHVTSSARVPSQRLIVTHTHKMYQVCMYPLAPAKFCADVLLGRHRC